MQGITNHFPPKNAQRRRISRSPNFPGGNIPEPARKRPRCLDPDNNFRLACQRSHGSCFTKRPLLWTRGYAEQQRYCTKLFTAHTHTFDLSPVGTRLHWCTDPRPVLVKGRDVLCCEREAKTKTVLSQNKTLRP